MCCGVAIEATERLRPPTTAAFPVGIALAAEGLTAAGLGPSAIELIIGVCRTLLAPPAATRCCWAAERDTRAKPPRRASTPTPRPMLTAIGMLACCCTVFSCGERSDVEAAK